MKKTYTKTWLSIEDVKRTNQELGHTHFHPETMKYFQTKIETDILYDRYYIESETKKYGAKNTRVWLINKVADDGSISHLHRPLAPLIPREFDSTYAAMSYLEFLMNPQSKRERLGGIYGLPSSSPQI